MPRLLCAVVGAGNQFTIPVTVEIVKPACPCVLGSGVGILYPRQRIATRSSLLEHPQHAARLPQHLLASVTIAVADAAWNPDILCCIALDESLTIERIDRQ